MLAGCSVVGNGNVKLGPFDLGKYDMNKKQVIVLWYAGLSIIALLAFEGQASKFLRQNAIVPHILDVLIVCGLFLVTFRIDDATSHMFVLKRVLPPFGVLLMVVVINAVFFTQREEAKPAPAPAPMAAPAPAPAAPPDFSSYGEPEDASKSTSTRNGGFVPLDSRIVDPWERAQKKKGSS